MKTGISLYMSASMEQNERIVEHAAAADVTYAFTSFQIPEELGVDFQHTLNGLLGKLRTAGISLIADVGPDACKMLGVDDIDGLRELGITHIRLDDGFGPEEAVELSHRFRIVFNASTITREEIKTWKRLGADLSRFSACHNFYPKRNTGLAIEDVRATDSLLAAFGFEIMGFVPTDDPTLARGPLFEGLPTVEFHRDRHDVALNMLQMRQEANCDIVLVGDPDLSDEGWKRLKQISQGYVELRCTLHPEYEYLYGQIHHDRPDSSALIFRSQESRRALRPAHVDVDGSAGLARDAGSIAISNKNYARYEGELEIARVALPGDERLNVIGTVDERDLRLLPYIKQAFGIRLVPSERRCRCDDGCPCLAGLVAGKNL